MRNAGLGLIGIFVAWQVFDKVFQPVFLLAVNLLVSGNELRMMKQQSEAIADCRMPISEGAHSRQREPMPRTAVPLQIGIRQSAIRHSVLSASDPCWPRARTREGRTEFYNTSSGRSAPYRRDRTLDHPWALAFLPDGRMLVTERGGTMRIVTAAGAVGAPLAGVPTVHAEGQGGLLDVGARPGLRHHAGDLVHLQRTGRGRSRAPRWRARGWATRRSTASRSCFGSCPRSVASAHFGSRHRVHARWPPVRHPGRAAAVRAAQDLMRAPGQGRAPDARWQRCPPTIRSSGGADAQPGDLVVRTPQSAGRRDPSRHRRSSGPWSTARWAATRSTRRCPAATTAGPSSPTGATTPAPRSARARRRRGWSSRCTTGIRRSRRAEWRSTPATGTRDGRAACSWARSSSA